jgi:hypothetical protein
MFRSVSPLESEVTESADVKNVSVLSMPRMEYLPSLR